MCSHMDTLMVGSIQVDRCLAGLVAALNTGSISTIASCCGHGEGDGFIAIEEDGVYRLLIVCRPGSESRLRYCSGFEERARAMAHRRWLAEGMGGLQ